MRAPGIYDSLYERVAFDPITGTLAAVGVAVSALGTIAQAGAASSAASYNSQVAARNATIARQQAEADAAQQQALATKTLGAMRAAYGASGISMEGAPLDVIYASASSAERDRQNILYKGALKAQGYEDQSALDSMRASSVLLEGYSKAGAGLLTGGADVKSRYFS